MGNLVDSKFRNISETHKAYLPEKENIKKMADAERHKGNPTPDQPITNEDENGHLFLQHECSKKAK